MNIRRANIIKSEIPFKSIIKAQAKKQVPYIMVDKAVSIFTNIFSIMNDMHNRFIKGVATHASTIKDHVLTLPLFSSKEPSMHTFFFIKNTKISEVHANSKPKKN